VKQVAISAGKQFPDHRLVVERRGGQLEILENSPIGESSVVRWVVTPEEVNSFGAEACAYPVAAAMQSRLMSHVLAEVKGHNMPGSSLYPLAQRAIHQLAEQLLEGLSAGQGIARVGDRLEVRDQALGFVRAFHG